MADNGTKPTSESDEMVLNALFNPEAPLSGSLPPQEPEGGGGTVGVADSPELVSAKALELQAVRAGEEGKLESALGLINTAIETAPDYPSLYNNRAQLLRMLGRTQDAMTDLNTAIELSGGVGNSAVMAFTQRGLLLKVEGKDELAWSDLKRAADLGGAFAKSILVQINPMAALCNRMLKQAVQDMYPSPNEQF